ncbi:MAG: NADH-quinone oxidoreductase subunit N [Bacteroidetes bacterium]|nr:NADH-quinone oxidoreductase subunit N [Bacteroidota bacterium]
MNAIVLTAFWGVVMMFAGAFLKSKSLPKYLAIAGIIIVFLANAIELKTQTSFFNIDLHNMIRTDSFNLTFIAVAVAATFLLFILNGKDFENIGIHVSEYFALIFFILCGVALSATFNTLLLMFLGIEIISIPLYILSGSEKKNLKSNEAALKYLLMGAFSTGIMLMGIAFIYGANENGSFFISNINLGAQPISPMFVVGLVFLLVSMSFKVSAAPFHFWAPDVYDGAPMVVTSFMATVVKVAAFIAFIRLFDNAFGKIHTQWQNLIVVITIATLLIGNITAVFQQSVKRMLAYSSIAQAGFMMLALLSLNDKGKEGIIIYSAAYSLATIGLFAVLVKMKDYTIDGFNGMAKKYPAIAVSAAIFLFSLTGIPLTIGFQAKFMMLLSVIEAGGYFWVVIIAVLFAAVSAFYYFRIIQAMFFKPALPDENSLAAGKSFKIIIVITAILIILLGVYPELLVGWIYS